MVTFMPSRASILTGHHPHGIQSMKMAGPYPGSTYDPKQCPFWPALFRKKLATGTSGGPTPNAGAPLLDDPTMTGDGELVQWVGRTRHARQ